MLAYACNLDCPRPHRIHALLVDLVDHDPTGTIDIILCPVGHDGGLANSDASRIAKGANLKAIRKTRVRAGGRGMSGIEWD
jgi:hypothetical protein